MTYREVGKENNYANKHKTRYEIGGHVCGGAGLCSYGSEMAAVLGMVRESGMFHRKAY